MSPLLVADLPISLSRAPSVYLVTVRTLVMEPVGLTWLLMPCYGIDWQTIGTTMVKHWTTTYGQIKWNLMKRMELGPSGTA